jgi:hypothetical protein
MTNFAMPLLVALGSAFALSACGAPSDGLKADAEGGKKVAYLGKESIPTDPVEQYYQQVCMSCHATGVGPEIRGRQLPVDAVKLFVRNGSRGMPAFPQSMLDDATLDGVAKLVSASKTPPAVPYPYAQ